MLYNDFFIEIYLCEKELVNDNNTIPSAPPVSSLY